MKTYSLSKGIGKALISVLIMAATFVSFAGFSDFSIWDLIEQYIKPLVGSLTVGGLIALAINYAKVRWG